MRTDTRTTVGPLRGDHSEFPIGLHAAAQAIALARHRDDLHMGEEAIEDRGRCGNVTEKQAPVLRRAIRGDQRGRRLVALH